MTFGIMWVLQTVGRVTIVISGMLEPVMDAFAPHLVGLFSQLPGADMLHGS